MMVGAHVPGTCHQLGCVKANCDASFFEHHRSGAIGIIARDNKDEVSSVLGKRKLDLFAVQLEAKVV